MCQFKSGIILKNRCYVAQGEDDSHTTLLQELNIADTSENAMTKFIRAELIPKNNEWWTSPDTWTFKVDQDITPDWFELDKEKYKKEFLDAVKEWCGIHILIDKKIEELNKGFYMLKRCEVKKICNDVKVMCDSSTVSRMYGSSTVSRMCGSSTVSRMYDSSTVSRMCGSSTVSRMYDSSTVSRMYDSSTVSDMCGSSTVSRMYGSSTVSRMYGSSIARDYTNKKIYIADETNLEIEKKK